MVAKDCPKKGSPKAIVGEIDTSAPFQSVKDAVNLFGEAAFSGEKPAIKKTKPHAAEITVGVLAKEYQLQLVQKELNKLKEQLKNAEISKVHALSDLAKAKQTVDDLISKLNIVSESKESAFKTAEEAKNQVKQIQETTSCHTNGHDGSRNQFLDTSRKEYISALAELEASKQELMKARRDCEAYEVAKNAAIKQAEDSKVAAILNIEKAGELSKQISTVNESIEQLKFANLHTGEKEANLNVDKDLEEESYKARVVESAKKLNALNEEVNSKLMQNLEPELAETESQIDLHQKRIDSIRASDRDSVISITSELDNAKESLHKVSKQEITLRQLVETLKMDLENVKKELLEAKVKEAEAEYVAGNLHVKLRISKAELEAATAEDSKLGAASEETLSALHRLSLENESCRLEAEKMKHQAEELRIEAEAIRVVQQEVEKELKVALQAAEEAKSAEAKVLEHVKILSERANATRATTSEPGTTQITISKEEFESLSRKVEESDKLAEMKVAAAMAQVEAVKASEDEALRKLEATLKEIDNMKAATVEALKRTEMAEAAKKAVEGELRRWREREQKMAAEVMSRILAENEVSLPSCPTVPQKQSPPQNVTGEARKLERAKTSVSRKVLRPSISGIFSRKKNQVEGAYASYLPGEHPV